MSSASQFFGGAKPPKLLVGSDDTGTLVVVPASLLDAGFGEKLNLRTMLSGATTAGVYKSLVSVSGSGVLSVLLLQSITAGPRDMHAKVTIDGVVVLERQKNAAGALRGCNVVGSLHATTGTGGFSFFNSDYLPFSKSLDISIKSSLSETDQISIAYRYHTT
jgi:hypothetical protein